MLPQVRNSLRRLSTRKTIPKTTSTNSESLTSLEDEIERRMRAYEEDDTQDDAEVFKAVEPAPLEEEGVALSTQGQLVTIGGLAQARTGTIATFESGTSAFIFNLRTNGVNAAIIDKGVQVHKGERVVDYSTDSVTFPVGHAVKGRVLNGLGEPIDEKGPLQGNVERQRSLATAVPGIATRGATTDPFMTGIKKIDLLSPIAKGQRVALVGAPGTGKTTTALNMLIHHAQSDPNAHCVYAAVGTLHSYEWKGVVNLLEQEDVLDQFTIVCADKNDSEAAKYLAPYGACAVAEWFQKNGQHAGVAYDDLVGHATSVVNLGQLSNMALADRTRYLHSNLLERAAQMGRDEKYGGGSMTAIALVDTPYSDDRHARQFSGDETYTLGQNTGATVSSIVDMTLHFDSKLVAQNKWPAIDLTEMTSVPTLAAQPKLLSTLSGGLYHMQVAARETIKQTEVMGEFGMDLYDEGRIEEGRRLKYWDKMEELLHNHRRGGNVDDDIPRIGGSNRGSFQKMGRVKSCELYITLVAGACGKLTYIPIPFVEQYEREMWSRAWEEDDGKMMEELEHAMLHGKNNGITTGVDPVVVEKVMTFVDQFTENFVDFLGQRANGEELSISENH